MKKLLADFFPLLLFFIAFKFGTIYIATGVAVIASILQILWMKIRKHEIKLINWINLLVIVVFGGLTLALHDDIFIRWKPTVLFWIFGLTLLVGIFMFKKSFLQSILATEIELPSQVWKKMTISWGFFFLFLGGLNLYVAFSGHYSESQWVNFKVFWITGLIFVFSIVQSVWLSKHIEEPK